MNPPIAFINNLNGGTLIVVALLVLLLFGGSKLPELARGLGKARREFKRASDEIEDEIKSAVEEDDRKAARLKQIEEEERAAIRAKIETEGLRQKQTKD